MVMMSMTMIMLLMIDDIFFSELNVKGANDIFSYIYHIVFLSKSIYLYPNLSQNWREKVEIGETTGIMCLEIDAERRSRVAWREMFTTPGLVTTRQSNLGPPAEG